MEINIKYFDKKMKKLEALEKGNWIDLYIRSCEILGSKGDWIEIPKEKLWRVQQGQTVRFKLNVAIQLPEGYEAILAPRSSTFIKKGIILGNSIGVIDTSYSGDNDEWMAICYAARYTTFEAGERLFQFRIIKSMDDINMIEHKKLEGKDRGGFGSTGK